MAAEKIIIMGYGNQARAWAENLFDSGLDVHLLLRNESNTRARVPAKFKLLDWQSPLQGHPIALLVPDHEIGRAISHLAEYIPQGTTLFYAHGFALHEEKLNIKFPQFHHVLLAPKAIGTEVRATYLEKRALGGVYSVELVDSIDREKIQTLTLAVAAALGITMGPYACRVQEEMIADLFSEQAVLCSLIPESCRMAFNLLIERGIPAELAFFELWHEVGLITKVMVDRGPVAFFDLISPNALIGSEKGRTLLVDSTLENKMRSLLSEIESGSFSKSVEGVDVVRLRQQIVERWKKDPMGQIIERMSLENK